MGDVIHGMPAIAALRRARPELKIGWLVEERWSELLCSQPSQRLAPGSALKPLVDWVHVANFSAWRKALSSGQSWREMRACVREVRAMHYDVVLDLQGAIRSALASRMSGAHEIVGSSQPREGPATMFYTQSVSVQGTHVIDHALSLASAVAGERLSYAEPVFPCNQAAESWAEHFHLRAGNKPLAILNPGAGWGAKCWPADSFGLVAQSLAARGMAIVINHGPNEESLAESVRMASAGTAIPLRCSVSELIALTRRAHLFIGGDTGPMHLAAALQVPVVALFGPTRPERNGPFGTRSIVLRSPESVHNTSHTDVPDEGLVSIEARSVIEAADQLLGGPSA
jgi:heptosyltransferase-1